MAAFNIQIIDKVTPHLTSLQATPAVMTPFFQAMGKRGEVYLRGYFRARQSEGNRKGWRDRYFWYGTAGVAQHTKLTQVDASGATITIDDIRLAHKIKGGPVYPQRGKTIAIPLNEEAYLKSDQGRIPDVFPDLKCIVTSKGVWLVRSNFERKTTKGKWQGIRDTSKSPTVARERLEFMFRLVPKVTHKPDPRAVPSKAEFEAALLPHAQAYWQRKMGGSTP